MPDDDTTPADGFADAFTPWPVFVEKHFPMPPGRKRSKRSERDLARKYRFELVRIGHHNFVDERRETERLRKELERRAVDRAPRRPGRPKKNGAE